MQQFFYVLDLPYVGDLWLWVWIDLNEYLLQFFQQCLKKKYFFCYTQLKPDENWYTWKIKNSCDCYFQYMGVSDEEIEIVVKNYLNNRLKIKLCCFQFSLNGFKKLKVLCCRLQAKFQIKWKHKSSKQNSSIENHFF